ncbi:hypothetical protein NUSPORA_00368 [Nucleospora cyclopteri]
MMKRKLQSKYRKHLGSIETKKETISRLKRIKKEQKDKKEKLLQQNNQRKDCYKFSFYSKNDVEEINKQKDIEKQLYNINKEIKRVEKKLKNEYTDPMLISTKIIFGEEDQIVNKSEVRDVTGVEKEYRDYLEQLIGFKKSLIDD